MEAQNSIGNFALLRPLHRARETGSSEMTDGNGVHQARAIGIIRRRVFFQPVDSVVRIARNGPSGAGRPPTLLPEI